MLSFPPEILKKRQKMFFAKLPPNSIAILSSDGPKIRSNDVEYRFRPSSRLLYLTGIKDPLTIVVFSKIKLKDGCENKITVFRRKVEFEEAVWTGEPTSDDELMKICDEIEDIQNFESKITKMLQNTEFLLYPIGESERVQNILLKSYVELKKKARTGNLPPRVIEDIDNILGELRAKKDEYEIEIIRKAVKITKHTLQKIEIRPGMMEYEVESWILNSYRSYGGEEAFPTIVASGKNSTILHYNKNSSPVGIPCVIDTGVEFNFYASDITRTIVPESLASDAISKERFKIATELRSQIEKIQAKIIEKANKDVSFEDLNKMAQIEISALLIDLGILKFGLDEIIERKLFKPFFPHRIGHHLGLDAHDVCLYYEAPNKPKKLEEGNVITVEPGIYIPDLESVFIKDGKVYRKPEDKSFYKIDILKPLRGIGIRVEDDILITKDGNEVL